MYSVIINDKDGNIHSENCTRGRAAVLVYIATKKKSVVSDMLETVKDTGRWKRNAGALHIEVEKNVYPTIVGDKNMTLADVEALANGDGE